jgi:multicomponent Na+:H+ antiporter subunit D
LFAAALAALFLKPLGQHIALLLGAAASAALVLTLPDGPSASVEVAGLALLPLQADALSTVFAAAFALYAVVAAIFAWSDDSTTASVFSAVLAGGGIGVSLAGDMITLFVFWEMLAISSLFLVWAGSDKQSGPAGFRYVIFHLAGGLCLLTGIVMHLQAGGENTLAAMSLDGAAAWLMLIGVLVNAAVPPLHAWLPDAYPRASIFGTVFLAAFTTKSAVYVLARLFPETEPLVWLGAVMTLYGVVFAVLENDIRRLLGYHIISQVGYMVCGVGIGSEMAVNGSAAHAAAHIFYKGLLMMSAGAVVWATGRGKLSELGGLARPLPWVMILFTIGAFSISGVPLFNGFISKSMVISAAAEDHRATVEVMLNVASMGTFLSIGLKLLWFMFFGNEPKTTSVTRAVPPSMYVAMTVAASVCIVTGVYPPLLYSALPYHAEYHPYTLDHVITALQLLIGTALGFWILRRVFVGKPTITLDVDRLYRRPLGLAVTTASVVLERSFNAAEKTMQAIVYAIRRMPERIAAVGSLPMGYRVALIVMALVSLWCVSWISGEWA